MPDSFNSQDLQRAMRSLRDVINGGTGAVGDNSRAGDEALKNRSKDMSKRAVKSAKETSDMVLNLKAAALDAGGAVAKFALKVKETGDIDALEEIIDGVAKAAGEFKVDTDEFGNKVTKSGKETYDKLGKFGKAGNMMIGGVGLVADGSKFLLKRLKENRDMFYELSNSSMVGAGGMSEMQDMWLQSGMKSDNWKKVLVDSSESIALLGTSTTDSTGNLSKSMNNLWLSSREFRNIGFSEEEMGAAASKALDIELRTGGRSLKSVPEMTNAIGQYANQLDTLTRITGQSKDKAADAYSAVRENPKYQAWRYSQLKTGKRTEEELQAIDTTLTAQYAKSERTGRGMMDMLAADGGVISDDAKALAAAGISTNAIFSKENKTSAQQTAVMNKQTADFVKTGQAYQMYIEPGQEAMMTLVDARQSMTVTAEGFEQAAADQAKLKAGADKQTDATFEAQQNMSKMYVNTNKQITEFLPKFAEMTNATAQGISYLTDDMINLGKQLGVQMNAAKVGVQHAVEAVQEGISNTFGGPGSAGGKSILDTATSMLGKNEAQNGKELNDWMNEHSGTKASSIATAWCARFVNSVLDTQGVKGTRNASAASFKTWGNEVWSQGQDRAGLSKVQAGDVITIAAPTQSGSHVAIVRGIDEKTGRILTIGGNQSDAVTQGSVDVNKVQSIRRAPNMPSVPTNVAATEPPAKTLPEETKRAQANTQQPIAPVQTPTTVTSVEPSAKAKLEAGTVPTAPTSKPTNVATTGLPSNTSFMDASKTATSGQQPSASPLATPGNRVTSTPTQYAQASTGSTAAPNVTTPNTNYNQPVVNNPTPQSAPEASPNSEATMTITLAQLFQETLSHTTALSASLEGTSKSMMTLATNAKDAAKAIK